VENSLRLRRIIHVKFVSGFDGPTLTQDRRVHLKGPRWLLGGVFGFLARPDEGIPSMPARDTNSGFLLRAPIPAIIVVPIVIGWLRLAGQRANLYVPTRFFPDYGDCLWGFNPEDNVFPKLREFKR
jgi:hypothetical protein